MIGISFN